MLRHNSHRHFKAVTSHKGHVAERSNGLLGPQNLTDTLTETLGLGHAWPARPSYDTCEGKQPLPAPFFGSFPLVLVPDTLKVKASGRCLHQGFWCQKRAVKASVRFALPSWVFWHRKGMCFSKWGWFGLAWLCWGFGLEPKKKETRPFVSLVLLGSACRDFSVFE